MDEKWVLTVKTALPEVCYDENDLVTTTFTFDSFDAARKGLRAKLRELAFSRNKMFDGYGGIIHMENYMNLVKEEEAEFEQLRLENNWEPLPEWFGGEAAAAVQKVFSTITEGKDVDFPLPCGYFYNADIEVALNTNTLRIRGTEEGQVNGYDPKIDTNLLSMQEEKNYFLYINDWFGQWADASAELYIDLKKEEFEQFTFPV